MDGDSELKKYKDQASEYIGNLLPKLTELASLVHSFSELKFEEYQSAGVLAKALDELGFDVKPKVAGLNTAFFATAGSGKPNIAFIGEYDALPGVGHGCGHNLMTPASIGAAYAVKSLIEKGNLSGSVAVIGTPAEEGGGGKVLMVEAGVFAGFDAAMMVHPFNRNRVDDGTIASTSCSVEFFGRSAHAAADPENGINALDALIQTFVGLNALRQHVTDDVRMHGIITHGGDAANVVPEYTRGEFVIRAATLEAALKVFDRFVACVEGAAKATGCTYKIHREKPYQERVPNGALHELFNANLRALGRTFEPLPESGGKGSSDMGNVSHVVPTIQPYLSITDPDITWHSRDVHERAVGERAFKMIEDAAKAMAHTAIDLLYSEDSLKKVKEEFEGWK